jgi:hypothetical protein
MAGNIAGDLSWSFVMQNYGADLATVTITGMKLNIPFTDVNSSVAETLKKSIAFSLSIPESRLANFMPSPAADGYTLFSFDILPPSFGTRRAGTLTAGEIAAMLGSLNGSQNEFLDQYLSPDSTVRLCNLFRRHLTVSAFTIRVISTHRRESQQWGKFWNIISSDRSIWSVL